MVRVDFTIGDTVTEHSIYSRLGIPYPHCLNKKVFGFQIGINFGITEEEEKRFLFALFKVTCMGGCCIFDIFQPCIHRYTLQSKACPCTIVGMSTKKLLAFRAPCIHTAFTLPLFTFHKCSFCSVSSQFCKLPLSALPGVTAQPLPLARHMKNPGRLAALRPCKMCYPLCSAPFFATFCTSRSHGVTEFRVSEKSLQACCAEFKQPA